MLHSEVDLKEVPPGVANVQGERDKEGKQLRVHSLWQGEHKFCGSSSTAGVSRASAPPLKYTFGQCPLRAS